MNNERNVSQMHELIEEAMRDVATINRADFCLAFAEELASEAVQLPIRATYSRDAITGMMVGFGARVAYRLFGEKRDEDI